jgi:tryptophan-rich sensory protein
MLDNLDLFEMLVIAAVAYAVYEASKIKDPKYKHVLYVIAVAGFLLLNGAAENTNTMESPDHDSIDLALGNYNAYELILMVALGYSAYILYQAGSTYGAIAAAAAALFSTVQAGDNATTH